MTKKIISLLLAVLMVVSAVVLVGCGDEKQPDETPKESKSTDESKDSGSPSDSGASGSESASDSGSESSTDPGRRVRPDGTIVLDDLDDHYNLNQSFVVLGEGAESVSVDEDNYDATDVLERAIFTRQSQMKERFNATIINRGFADAPTTNNALSADVGSGAHELDQLHASTKGTGHLCLDGYLYDLNKLDAVDFSKSYWVDEITEFWTYKGKTYWSTGDATLRYMENMCCVVMNDDIWNRYYQNEDIFEIVESGQWTLEEAGERIVNVLEDTNGDGILGNVGDLVGWCPAANWCTNSLAFAAGFQMTSRSGKTKWKIDLDNADNQRVWNEMKKLTSNKGFSLNYANNSQPEFDDGLILFINHPLTQKNGNVSYLPFPKCQVTDDYKTPFHEGQGIIGLSQSLVNTDPDYQQNAGIILEAMASLGRTYVTESYYEIVLRLKYTKNAGSYRCMEIIHDRVFADFAFSWCGAISGADQFPVDYRTAELSTAAAQAGPQFENALNNIYSKLNKLG